MARRILHCIPGMGGGGAERQLSYLCGELVQRGWDVHVALVTEGPNFDRLRRGGATIHKVQANGNHDPGLFLRLARTMARVKPDLAQVWMLQMEILGSLAASLRGIPWIFSERCSEAAYPPTMKYRLRRWAATRASAIVSNSRGGDEYWAPILDASIPRYVIPNALPLEEIGVVSAVNGNEARLTPSERVILFAGRLTEQKNPDGFLRALVQVLERPFTVGVIAGEGPMKERLAGLVKEYGIGDRVRFTGYVSTLWAWMKRASVFVSPALFEGHPNTVMEAAACGCPLVVSDIPAHEEFLDETRAWLVPAGDTARLVGAINDVLDRPEEAGRRAALAAATAAQWSARRIAEQYEHVYLDVLTRTARSKGR
jgi:glycosyltransferase involved in cell wall biosynthesis